MSNIYLDDEFFRVWEKIENNENFALLRYGDGERAVMTGRSVKAQEGWVSPDFVSELGSALLNTLNVEDENFIYGISCPCCDRSAYYWYSTRIKSKNRTFANIFVNKNYTVFIEKFEKLKRDAVVIGNFRGKDSQIANLNVLKYYSVSDDCFEFWKRDASTLIEQIKKDFGHKNNLLYVVCAGPMSEPIIYELYKNNPDNCYIDFGSSLDRYIHKKQTRPYENPDNKYAGRNCVMQNPNTTDFDVSVVLTLYKRPENLALQLEAINNQTLKPAEIILFQDVPESAEPAVIPDELYRQFDRVKTVKTNAGVWGRFDFARKSNSKYVCIFDDDTIPGACWLENCHYNMQQHEGVYGTIGILMKQPSDYPFKNYIRIGWSAPNKKAMRVDFVGHCWFVKKEWLEYMFEDTEKFQAYKYVAEDMCLSAKLKMGYGIPTYVAPHPLKNMELWGSLNKYAVKLGTNSAAVSMNSDNLSLMNKAMGDLLSCGYRPIVFSDEKYVSDMCKKSRVAEILTKYIPVKTLRHNIRMKLKEILLSQGQK